MKRIDEIYKRLLLREDDGNQIFDTPEPLPPLPPMAPNGLPERTPPILPYDPYPPLPTYNPEKPYPYPVWKQIYPDIWQNDPNFQGWPQWDGTPPPPKTWPHILDPNGVFPPIPLTPERPPNYPTWEPWPPPPGSPWYENFKLLWQNINNIPDWVKTPQDLEQWLRKIRNDYGVHIYSQEQFNTFVNLLQLFFWAMPWTRFIKIAATAKKWSKGIETRLDAIDTEQGEAQEYMPPAPWEPDNPIYPWGEGDPRPGQVPWGWYEDDTGVWQQIFPDSMPKIPGSIDWRQSPPPARWVWLNPQGRPVLQFFPGPRNNPHFFDGEGWVPMDWHPQYPQWPGENPWYGPPTW